MKILPVNNMNLQSFHGLWSANRAKSTNLKYYPFADETPEQISKNTKDYSSFVAIMAALPFSSKEFLNYTKNRLSIIKQRLIERHFYQKGLSTLVK